MGNDDPRGPVTNEERIVVLEAFGQAGDLHDIDGMMSLMTDDCVFDSAFGPDAHGTRYEGRDQVRDGLQSFLDIAPDGRWADAQHFVRGDRGVSEWTFTGTAQDGSRIEVAGCDVVTFRGRKIAVKNSFRKERRTR